MSDWRIEVVTRLGKERDSIELHRLQGELKAIDTVISLQGIVRDYAKGLQDGSMKPIGDENAKSV